MQTAPDLLTTRARRADLVGAGMGWLRVADSLKSYVSFAENRLFYRALSQKRHIIVRSLLIVATP